MFNTSMRLPAALRQLPPLPQALSTALDVIRNDHSQRSDLVRVLSLDESLTGLFLRMINSAYYGLPRRVTSLDEAIGYLGYENVESVIFAIASSKVLSGPVPAYLMERGALWEHAVAVASGAEWIAKKRGITPLSDAYVAGLLHDVGKLVMDVILEHQAQWRKGYDDPEKKDWLEIERQVTGHDHAEVGAILTRSWNLTDRVVEAIALHHVPAQAQVDPRLTAAIHIANAASLMAGIGLGIDGLCKSLDASALQLLDWSSADMEDLMSVVQGAVARAKDVLRIRS